MYYYILDPTGLDEITFEKKAVELQGLLAEFRISGEMGRVSSLRSIQDLVQTASERGVKTLIACGTDDTFNLMLSCLKGREFTLGFIPLDQTSYLGTILGISNLAVAVKTVAARRLKRIDLALMGSTFFISYVEFGIASSRLQKMGLWSSIKALSMPEYKIKIKVDNSYVMDITCLGGIVANSRRATKNSEKIANPTDGFLDLLVLEKIGKIDVVKYKEAISAGSIELVPGSSVIKCRRVEFLEPRGLPLTMAGRTFAKIPATVEIVPKQLKLIVGRERTF